MDGLNNWSEVEGGIYHNILLNDNGSLWTIGDNLYGQLGDGTFEDRNELTKIGNDNNWESVSSGRAHSAAIKADGTLWLWGRNLLGQIGDGSTTNRNVPIQIGDSNHWVKVNGGFGFTIALDAEGNLWSWGDNYYGTLGDGTFIDKLTPVLVECPTINSTNEIVNQEIVKVYPNPTADKLKIIWLKETQKKFSYSIVNSLGELLISPTILNDKETLDLLDLPSGLIVLKIFNQDESQTIKVLKI